MFKKYLKLWNIVYELFFFLKKKNNQHYFFRIKIKNLSQNVFFEYHSVCNCHCMVRDRKIIY